MRDMFILFDAVRYDNYVQADTPVLDSIGKAVKAYTHGTWTRPSMTSILSGYLPTSELGQPFKPSWVMLSDQVFHDVERKAWVIHANAWIKHMKPRRYTDVFYPKQYSADDMIRKALQIMEINDDCFIVMLFTETHGPYDLPGEPETSWREVIEKFKAFNHGEDNDAPEIAVERQIKAIEYLDEKVKPLIGMADSVIFSADHGELMGEKNKVGHDPSFPFHVKLLEVPLIISGR